MSKNKFLLLIGMVLCSHSHFALSASFQRNTYTYGLGGAVAGGFLFGALKWTNSAGVSTLSHALNCVGWAGLAGSLIGNYKDATIWQRWWNEIKDECDNKKQEGTRAQGMLKELKEKLEREAKAKDECKEMITAQGKLNKKLLKTNNKQKKQIEDCLSEYEYLKFDMATLICFASNNVQKKSAIEEFQQKKFFSQFTRDTRAEYFKPQATEE